MNAKGAFGVFTLDLDGSVADDHEIVWVATYAARVEGASSETRWLFQTVGVERVRSRSEIAEDLAEKWSIKYPSHKVLYDPNNEDDVVFEDAPDVYCGPKITKEMTILPGFSVEPA